MEKNSKYSAVWSWLGFGFMAVLVFIVTLMGIIYLSKDNGDSMEAIYVMMYIYGSMLAIMALAFSIVGLNSAVNHGQPKWMAISGIVLFAVYVPILLLPAFVSSDDEKGYDKGIYESSEACEVDEEQTVGRLRIYLDTEGRVVCVNTINGVNSPAESSFNLNSNYFERDFGAMLDSMSDYEKAKLNEGLSIDLFFGKDLSYNAADSVMKVLKNHGLNKFTLKTTLIKEEQDL